MASSDRIAWKAAGSLIYADSAFGAHFASLDYHIASRFIALGLADAL